nr:histidine phosphatase family protein [Pedobacter sp. ASV2]
MKNIKNVWFIRHAESVANVGLPTSDFGEIGLTIKGFEQADTLAHGINKTPDLIVVTPFLRTQQTAKALIEKYPNVPTEIWPLQEYQFLAQQYCINSTIKQRKPHVDDYWQKCDPEYVQGDGAESFAQFRNRVIKGINDLERRSERFIIVFAHGHVIRAICQYLDFEKNICEKANMMHYRDKMSKIDIFNATIYPKSFDGKSWSSSSVLPV